MSFDPYKDLRVNFYENGDVGVLSSSEPDAIVLAEDRFTASEIGLVMMATNEVLLPRKDGDNDDMSLKILSVGHNSLVVPLIVWRLLGSPTNPRHELFLHNLWGESDLVVLKNLIAAHELPFVLRNGIVTNTLKSYFAGQIAFVWYTRVNRGGGSLNDAEEEYKQVFDETTLLKNALAANYAVLICRPSSQAETRAVQDVFMGYEIRQLKKTPNLIMVLKR